MIAMEPSTLALRSAIAALEPQPWLRDHIIAALEDASKAVSVASFYHRYFSRLLLAFEDPEDAELVEFLFSRMLESEAVVNAHVEEQRDHLRHTIHDFLLGYLVLNATPYFHPIAEAFARHIGYRGDGMACLNHAWFLAAHFHDLGYPVEFHSYLLDFVRKIISDVPHVSHVSSGARMAYRGDAPLASLFAWRAGLYGIIEGEEGSIATLPTRAVLDQISRPDHAFAAAFLLWDRASDGGSRPSPKMCFTAPVLRTAALACASHNFQYLVHHGEWFRISFARDPVSWLLQLVDEVQDWSRERIDVDMLWDVGVATHRNARAILCEGPCVVVDKNGRLDISYAVAVQPLLDDPGDTNQFLRAREFLERDLIERSRRLAGVLKMEKPSILLEGRYFVGSSAWPSDSYEECFVRLAIGEPQTGWKRKFQKVPSCVMPALERAGAVEVVNRQQGARMGLDPDGNPKPQGCILGKARITLDPGGKVTLDGLQCGKVYLLIGAGGVGKSILLRHVAMNPPSSYSAYYLDVIPPNVRELDLDETTERPIRLFLVDHFDHVLSRREAEYWKGEIARLPVPPDAVLILACRTEVADQWPYLEARKDIQVIEAYRAGCDHLRPENFVQEKLRPLHPHAREELAALAFRERGERWILKKDVNRTLLDRAGGMLRAVGEHVRFDHDHVQDALATLGILRAISRRDEDFDLGQALVAHPPWVYAFLLWSLCGENRGVTPFLDLGREAYRRLRRDTLDWLLRSSRALQWLQHTGGSDVGASGDEGLCLPIEALDEVLTRESDTVRPEHRGLVRELVARSFFHQRCRVAPTTKEQASEIVELALQFRDLAEKAESYFAAQPTIPARWWAVRRCNVLLTRVYIWSRSWPEIHCQMEFWENWKQRWDEERRWIESVSVDEAVREYWLSIWLNQRSNVELENLKDYPIRSPSDREYVIGRLRNAIELNKKAISLRRRTIARTTDKAADGFQTLAHGIGQQAHLYDSVIRDSWPILGRLGEDPLHLVQLTVTYERERRSLWERARRVVQPRESLAFFYPRCAHVAAYAAAVRAFRDNPARPLHEVLKAAEKVFGDWLNIYPFEAARDPSFVAETEMDSTRETIQQMEGLLRNEARRWTGEQGGQNE